MTHAQHRVAVQAQTPQPGGVIRSPRLWAVAWRQHRIQIAVMAGIMAVAALALLWFRARALSLYAEFDCPLFPAVDQTTASDCVDADGASVWYNHGLNALSDLAHLGMLGGPVVLGVFAAAPIFTREFAHGTQILALTQSVSRRSWFAVKTTIMAVPLVAGLLVLGFLMEWVDLSMGVTDYGAMNSDMFLTRSIVPAATGLVTFALTVAVGMLVRNVVTTLVVGLLAGLALLAGAGWLQPHVLPADRTVTPLSTVYAPVSQAEYDAMMNGTAPWPGDPKTNRNDAWVTSGYLDAEGTEIRQTAGLMTPCYNASGEAVEQAADEATTGPDAISYEDFYNSAEYRNIDNAYMLECLTALGVNAQYADILPVSKLWPLREIMSGILLALAAVFIGVGAWRLRWTVAKR